MKIWQKKNDGREMEKKDKRKIKITYLEVIKMKHQKLLLLALLVLPSLLLSRNLPIKTKKRVAFSYFENATRFFESN
jgi:hypothetical protein